MHFPNLVNMSQANKTFTYTIDFRNFIYKTLPVFCMTYNIIFVCSVTLKITVKIV